MLSPRMELQDRMWETLTFANPELPDPDGHRQALATRLDEIFASNASMAVLQSAVHAIELAYRLGNASVRNTGD